MKKLRWFLFSRKLEDPDDGFRYNLGWATSFQIAFPRLWRVGLITDQCGCSHRFWSEKKVLICLPHVRKKYEALL